MTRSKLTTGSNDRPKDETIAQTGEGLPDDTGKPVDVDDSQVEAVRNKLSRDNPRERLRKEVEKDIERPQKGSA